MTKIGAALPVVALLLATVAGCSSSGGGATGTAAGGSGTAAAPVVTSAGGSAAGGGPSANAAACTLFSTAKIDAAFTISVGTGMKDDTAPNGCTWAKGTAPVFMTTIIKTAETDLSNELATVKGYSKTPQKLGDDSAFVSLGASVGNETSLVVIKSGQMYQFILYRGSTGQPPATDKTAMINLVKPIFQ